MAHLRYALRMMAKSPAFTAIAILTLTLGVGANTAVFTVVNALVLRALPVADPDHLVAVNTSNPARGVRGGAFSVASYETLRDRNHSFDGVTAFCFDSLTYTGGAEPLPLRVGRVAPNFLDVLGTPPFLGRGFRPAEGEPGGAPVALISYAFWQIRFNGDRAILNKPLPLDREVYTIIGVLPPNYAFPDPYRDVLVTRIMKFGGFQPEQIAAGAGYLTGIARLAPGAPLARAQAETAAAFQQYRQEHPRAPDADPNGRIDLVPIQESLSSGIRPTLLILTGAVALVLLIACANVAGLTMARSSARAREIAVRAALGASRGQLIRQLLAESLLLSVAGAALGVLLAKWAVDALVKADAGLTLPAYQPIRLDLTVLAFTVAVSMITGAAFGLIPALQISRPNLVVALRAGGWGTTGGHRHWMRSILVTGQMGLSIVLLIGAGLLLQSFRKVQNVRLGFDPRHAITAQVALPPARYPQERHAQFAQQIVERLSALPGVTSASLSQSVPFSAYVFSPVLAEGQPFQPLGQRPLAQWNGITPGYLKTTGTPLLRGRDFTWADDANATRVIIVSEGFVRRFWPNQDALGKHVTFTRFQVPYEIVGITADTRTSAVEADPFLLLYSPYLQWTTQTVVVAARTHGDPHQLANAIAAQVAAIDRDLPATSVRTLEEMVANSLSQRRETLYLIAGFAAVALVLAVIGLYGVMAWSVSQRTAEIGLRQAIGAQRRDILRMVLAQGLRLSLLGVVIGTVAAIVSTRLIARLLYGVSATDPIIFAAIAGLFLLVAAAASLGPAWRATRVDPLVALRS